MTKSAFLRTVQSPAIITSAAFRAAKCQQICERIDTDNIKSLKDRFRCCMDKPATGHTKGDIVTVNGKQFEVNYVTPAYRNTLGHGGVCNPAFMRGFTTTMARFLAWIFANNIISFALLVLFAIAVAGPANPAESQTPDAQLPHIPEPVERAIIHGSLAKKYELAFRLNPSYLRGDFNGDGKIDVAVLVKQRSTGKLGIAIIHGVTDRVTILGAGTAIGNGGDDFEWMDTWQTYSKDRGGHAASETGLPLLRGDALLVGKSEAASALIYWNGKRYIWLQQGD